MKLRLVNVVDNPENIKLYRIRSKLTLVNVINDVLNGGYNVQPKPLPYSLIIGNVIIRNEYGINKTVDKLILGYITSDAPKLRGKR